MHGPARHASGSSIPCDARRSPWQNAFVERLIGSIKRECTDHIIPMGEAHSLRTVRAYADYDNNDRPHQSPGGGAPIPLIFEGSAIRPLRSAFGAFSRDTRRRVGTAFFALAFAAVLVTIADLDDGNRGLLRISQ